MFSHKKCLAQLKNLGIHWKTEDDFFYTNVKVESKPLTRRTLLFIVCSIYDLLGLSSPFVLEGKKLLQTLSKSQYPTCTTTLFLW